MRVALVINQLDLGGAETIVCRLACGAAARGIEVAVWAVRGLGRRALDLQRAGIPISSLDLRRGLARQPQALPVVARRLAAELRRCRVDLVHSFLFEANAVTRLAARRARLRAIASFRSNAFRLPVERWLERATGHWVSRYTAVSRAVADQASACLGIDRARIEVIHNGIPVAAAAPPTAVRTIGYLGRLHREKGLDVLLAALARLGERAPRLAIAGAGSDREAFEREARALGLSDRVRFVGAVDDGTAFIDAVDAIVVPARHEGLSNAALEAMARARPVIASDAGGNRELVLDGVTGLIVPADDAGALAAALTHLIHDLDPAALGAAAHARAAQLFDDKKLLQRTCALWAQVCSEPLPFGRAEG
ncbi:MAG: glycosyltransferase [Deltaproteobacteria bacterium]|nr:glycosyltransferase [Deltaproteobacteria bacterium]